MRAWSCGSRTCARAARRRRTEAGFTDSDFSAEVEEAERWRNDRDLTALIVVIAHGDEAKLSSLEDFSAVTSRELKHILVRRALGEEAGQNEVQVRWWRLLDEDDSIGLGPLIDYYTALVGKTGEDYLDASSREIYHLGLLPDHEFFNDPREAAVKRRLETQPRVVEPPPDAQRAGPAPDQRGAQSRDRSPTSARAFRRH